MFYRLGRFVVLVIFHILYRVKASGFENIPETGGVIICANHASGLDPIFIGTSMKRSLRFMAKQELFQNFFLGKLLTNLGCFPVDRKNVSMDTYKNAVGVLKNGECLLIFAQGARMKELDSKNAKSGVTLFGVKSGAKVVPTGVSSSYKLFSRVHVQFGEPISLEEYQDQKLRSEALNEITEGIMEKVQLLIAK